MVGLKRKDLEIALQGLKTFQSPRPADEQYPTPANIAADMAFTAFSLGDVAGRRVADLGCGTGILGIAAALLGAREVVGIDKDPEALALAGENAGLAGVELRLYQGDVSEFGGRVDTVLMNPPFGSQRRHADRPFLETAMSVASVVYSLHNAVTEPFLRDMIASTGNRAESLKRYKLGIPHTFAFHKKAKWDVEVLLLRIQIVGETQ